MKRNIILTVLLALFLIGSFFQNGMVIKKKFTDLKDLKNEQKKVNEKFISADLINKGLDRVTDLFNNNLALSLGDVKNDEASLIFLDNLTDVFNNLNVQILNIKPKRKEKRGKHIFIPYQLELVCTFEEFANLVNDLEKNERLIVIDEFHFFSNLDKLSRKQDPESIMNHKVELIISTVTLNKSKG